jgi:hypothetical protein
MAAESAAWVGERLAGETPYERIIDFARLMIEINAGEPNNYSIFLSTDIDYGYFQRRDGHPFVHPAYAMLLGEIGKLPGLVSGGAEAGDNARILADILTYVFHSKLHFYIRYGTPPSLDLLKAEVLEETRFILDRSKADGR